MAEVRCNLFSLNVREDVTCYESQLQVEGGEVLLERKFVIMNTEVGLRNSREETEMETTTLKQKRGRPRKKRNLESTESVMQPQEKRRRSARQRKQQNLDLKMCYCNKKGTSHVSTSGTSKRRKRQKSSTSRKTRSNRKSQQPSKRQKISTSFFQDLQEGYPNNKENHYVEKIIGCAERNGRRYVIVKWKNVNYPTIIDERKINEYIKNLVVFHHLKEITRIKDKGRARSKPTGRSCDGSAIPVKTEKSSEKDYRTKQSEVFDKEALADTRVDIKIENN